MQSNSYKWKVSILLVTVMFLLYGTLFSIHGVLKHSAFGTSYDLSIFTQVFWNIVHYGTLANSLEGVSANITFVNHLAVHFSPIFYFFAPIYYFFQDAQTLLILQSFALGSGVFPIYFLAKEKTGNAFLAIALCVCYLLYLPLHFANHEDFHETVFAVPLFLWCLYCLENKGYKLFWCFLILALLVKEDMALSGTAIGLYICTSKKEYKLGASVIATSIIYFLLTLNFMSMFSGHRDFADWYSALIPPDHNSYLAILLTLVRYPIKVIIYIFADREKLAFLANLFLPVLFLPFLNQFRAFILLIPCLMVSLLANHSSMNLFDIHTHYAAPIIPFIFFLTILGCTNINVQIRKFVLPGMLIITSFLFNYNSGLLFDANFTVLPKLDAKYCDLFRSAFLTKPDVKLAPHYNTLNAMIKQIPATASVRATGTIIPHLANRRAVAYEGLPSKADNIDYILLDIRDINIKGSYMNTYLPHYLKLLHDNVYGVVAYENNCLLLKRGYKITQNQETISKLIKLGAKHD